jgi:hypothetical protein
MRAVEDYAACGRADLHNARFALERVPQSPARLCDVNGDVERRWVWHWHDELGL